MCVSCALGGQKSTLDFLVLELQPVVKLLCGYWYLSPGLLKVQRMILTTELTLAQACKRLKMRRFRSERVSSTALVRSYGIAPSCLFLVWKIL